MHPDKEEFRKLLNILGWSQSEAGRRLKMTSQAVSKILNPNDSNKPSPIRLHYLKEIVAAEKPDQLKPADYEIREDWMTPKEKELIERLRLLDDADRKKVLDMAGDMIGAFSQRVRHPVKTSYSAKSKR